MNQFLAVLTFISVSAFAADPVDQFFDNLQGKVGEYHQASVLLQTSPTAESEDLNKHDRKNTLTVRRISADRYSFFIFGTGPTEATNEAGTVVFERKDGKVLLTSLDIVHPEDSFSVESKVSNTGTELHYYQSDVKYLVNTPEAIAARKGRLEQRQLAYAIIVLALTLQGKDVAAEVIQNNDWINIYVVAPGFRTPIAASEVLLDPRGKSELKPKGEPSLTVVKGYHTEE